MADNDSLLLPVFLELRRLGIPLGIPDYLLAVKMLREGIGLADMASLKRICRLLWTKSKEDQETFDVVFQKLVEIPLQPIQKPRKPSLPLVLPLEQNKASSRPEIVAVVEKQAMLDTLYLMSFNASSAKVSLVPQPVKYHLTPRLPLDRREMTGLWRHFRNLQRQGPLEELDVEGTITNISRTGLFLGPVLQPRRRNRAKLVLLVDQLGSMGPFSLLIDALIESVYQSGLVAQAHVYYFHDCPEGVVYEHPTLSLSRPLQDMLAENAKNTAVLIVSDAGAARGDYDGRRLRHTKTFLQDVRTYTYLYAWLNPMPAERWTTTTAEEIAHMVPMFPLDREGLNDVINILRGYPFPPGVNRG